MCENIVGERSLDGAYELIDLLLDNVVQLQQRLDVAEVDYEYVVAHKRAIHELWANLKFIIKETKKVLEELDGNTSFASSLSARLVSIEERLETSREPKHKQIYGGFET